MNMESGHKMNVYAGPRAWNTLPDFITDCSSLHTFKQSLKTYLFGLSFWAHNNTLFYDCVKRPSSSLCRFRRFKIVRFTLQYITLLWILTAYMLVDKDSVISDGGHVWHRCPRCKGEDSRVPAMCLVCGEVVCSQSYCCQTDIEGVTVGAATLHASVCGAGTGIFLRYLSSLSFTLTCSEMFDILA